MTDAHQESSEPRHNYWFCSRCDHWTIVDNFDLCRPCRKKLRALGRSRSLLCADLVMFDGAEDLP